MPVQAHTAEPLPAGCFSLEEVHQLQSTAGRTLTQVSYYLWASAESDAEAGFLYFLELSFDAGPALYLTCGEDSTGIQVSDAAALIETAHQLQALHGKPCIRHIAAHNTSALWQPVVGRPLHAIHLMRHESGLYANEALQLEFGDRQIVIELAEQEGLAVVG
ncbi:MAG TPA: hypothetical protein PK971_00565 [Saprospiraceae bacterium]|nr:hypothetical protein [Saprospiraceae bacterium]HND86783.1 hypothetical protein [Saprospiraceae bacterium]